MEKIYTALYFSIFRANPLKWSVMAASTLIMVAFSNIGPIPPPFEKCAIRVQMLFIFWHIDYSKIWFIENILKHV